MTQPARAAVNADHDLAEPQAEGFRRLGVVDLGNFLHFEVMVART
jgi:hypothetical protein